MTHKLARKGPPKGLMRWFLRAPIALYGTRLGWLLGKRFLLLEHIGRKSGVVRKTVLEVVKHDADRDHWFIASGWGEKAQWLRNVLAEPNVHITVGARRFAVRATRLDVDAATRVLAEYAMKNPTAFRNLSSFMLGDKLGPSEASARRLAEAVPLLELAPR